MEKLYLCNSDLYVSRFCFGGCPMGGYGWGNVQDELLLEAVNYALDRGVNFFDTADTYGLGHSEKTLAKALNGRRKEAVIATKFGVRMENGVTFYDNTPQWIEQACHESLNRLQTDYIDLYQVHYRDNETPISSVVESLERLKEKGYIRYYGLSNIHERDMAELHTYKGKFVSFQDEFSLACRKNEEDIFKIQQQLKMTPLTWGSLGQGILTGKYNEKVTFNSSDRRSKEIYKNFHGKKLLQNLQIVEKIDKIAGRHKKPIAAVAIRWILDYISNSVVLVGVKNKSQVDANLQGLSWSLSDLEINELKEISKE